MRSKFLAPLFLLGVAIIVVGIVSWFAFPAWRARPSGGLELLGIVVLGVLAAARYLIGIARDLRDLQQNDKRKTDANSGTAQMNRVEASGKGSVAIGGSANNAHIQTGESSGKKKKNRKR